MTPLTFKRQFCQGFRSIVCRVPTCCCPILGHHANDCRHLVVLPHARVMNSCLCCVGSAPSVPCLGILVIPLRSKQKAPDHSGASCALLAYIRPASRPIISRNCDKQSAERRQAVRQIW